MKTFITRRYTLESAHTLDLPEEHKSSKLHGHTYNIEVTVGGSVTKGYLIDFDEMDDFVHLVLAPLDYADLNDFIDDPSTERVAAFLFREIGKVLPHGVNVVRLSMSENPLTVVTVRA